MSYGPQNKLPQPELHSIFLKLAILSKDIEAKKCMYTNITNHGLYYQRFRYLVSAKNWWSLVQDEL
jgi:hypothetical protein